MRRRAANASYGQSLRALWRGALEAVGDNRRRLSLADVPCVSRPRGKDGMLFLLRAIGAPEQKRSRYSSPTNIG